MIPIKKLLVTCALVFSVQGSSQAQDELVLLDHHHLLTGEVVSSTPDSVTFKHVVGDTDDTQTYSADKIDPHSFYIIRSRAVKGDAAAMVVLGEYCQTHGLFTRARNQYIEAMKLDKSLDLKANMAACEQGTATIMLDEAQTMAKSDKPEQAYYQATSIMRRFPGTSTASQAKQLSGTMYKQIVDTRNQKLAEHEARGGDEAIREITKETHRAADTNHAALQENAGSAAKTKFSQSIEEYKMALNKAEGLAKQYADNADLSKEVGDLVSKTKSELIEVYINLGSMYLTQTSYQEALKEANKAISVDPNSETAKSFRAQVASASSESEVGGYWGRGGARVEHRR